MKKKSKKKILCFDLDNVICTTQGKNYQKSKPKHKVINLINDLYESGHYIKIFTARYMGRNNENIVLAKKQGYKTTKKQINSWGINYHKLIFGKPTYDFFVDDKCYNFSKNWYLKFKDDVLKD
jgi:hypothetical protein